MMRTARMLAGWVCVVLGFAVMALLGLGLYDPTTAAAAQATSMTPVLIALLPSVSFGIAIFAVGVWLISTAKRK
jgi:hypothetical protein